MKTRAKRWMAVAAALALLTAAAVALSRAPRLLATSPLAELPDPPFSRVPDDFPRFIPVRENPERSDKAAYDAFWAEWRAVWKWQSEGGAVGRARPEEREAVAAAFDDRFAKAKSAALKVLGTDRDSIPALFALAMARVSGDANLPDGLFLIRRARRIAERQGQLNPADADAREWYLRTLWFEYSVLVDLGRDDEALRAVDIIERLYEPLPDLKVWILFKQERLDEADAAIQQSERAGHFPRRSANSRLALEGLRHRRKEQLEAARAATRYGENTPVIWSNTGDSALSCFQHADAEAGYLRAAQISIRLKRTGYSGSPFTSLSRLFVQEGRTSEALAILAQARTQRAERPPGTLADDQGEYDTSVALAMLALGRSEDAERFARRVVETPDRLGHTSDRPDDKALANAVMLWTVLASKRAEQAERGSSGWMNPDAESWALAKLATRIACQSGRPNIIRPYIPGSATIASWQLGSVLRMVPPGAALAMVAQARREEDHADAAPYFDALEAEARLLANDPAGALPLARKALEKLPKPGEQLLRGRTAAIAAEAARRLGQHDESRELWTAALADFPAAPRLLGLAIPVKIEAGADSSALADLLARSPRFRVESWGLPLRVRTADGRASIVLVRGDGSNHATFEHSLGSAPTPAQLAEASSQFHDRVAAPTIRLADTDVNALDGLPTRPLSRQDDATLAKISPNAKPGEQVR
jgi:tetratricopeptide (TPR) repeat protein